MTIPERWEGPGLREIPRVRRPLKKYDTRLVDQFYVYCQAIARTARHREEAWGRARVALHRRIAAGLIGGSLLGYYLIDRVAQAMSLF